MEDAIFGLKQFKYGFKIEHKFTGILNKLRRPSEGIVQFQDGSQYIGKLKDTYSIQFDEGKLI